MNYKIYKRIHSKYSRLFNFFFFLRYVFLIFLISISLFLFIPKFFNYEKKKEIISNYLINYYDLELINYSNIEYKIFPLPNLFIENTNLKIKKKSLNLKSNNIYIFLNYKNIYDYENFKAKKIILSQNEINIDVSQTKKLINYFKELKHKLDLKNLNLNLQKNKKSLIKIENIYFSNHGFNKNKVEGKIFGKKFKAVLKNNDQTLSFKLLETGIKAKVNFNEKDLYSGISRINLSNNLLRFNFNLKKNKFEIIDSNFRNKNLSFSFDSIIRFNPFFSIDSNININEIDKDLVDRVNLEKILENKEIIKKLNSKINIEYKSNKYFNNFIESNSSTINLAYGRINYLNKTSILGNEITCKSEGVLTDEYPRLNFICLINLKNKKKLFKKLSITKNHNADLLNINIQGTLNLFNKKINFKKIHIDENYTANEEDKKYFKDKFESILLNEGFFKILKEDKIKEFIMEII